MAGGKNHQRRWEVGIQGVSDFDVVGRLRDFDVAARQTITQRLRVEG